MTALAGHSPQSWNDFLMEFGTSRRGWHVMASGGKGGPCFEGALSWMGLEPDYPKGLLFLVIGLLGEPSRREYALPLRSLKWLETAPGCHDQLVLESETGAVTLEFDIPAEPASETGRSNPTVSLMAISLLAA